MFCASIGFGKNQHCLILIAVLAAILSGCVNDGLLGMNAVPTMGIVPPASEFVVLQHQPVVLVLFGVLLFLAVTGGVLYFIQAQKLTEQIAKPMIATTPTRR